MLRLNDTEMVENGDGGQCEWKEGCRKRMGKEECGGEIQREKMTG